MYTQTVPVSFHLHPHAPAHPHEGGLHGQKEAVSGEQGAVGGEEVDVGEVRRACVFLHACQQLGGVRGGGELVAVLGRRESVRKKRREASLRSHACLPIAGRRAR